MRDNRMMDSWMMDKWTMVSGIHHPSSIIHHPSIHPFIHSSIHLQLRIHPLLTILLLEPA
jgi:hypothetical protein